MTHAYDYESTELVTLSPFRPAPWGHRRHDVQVPRHASTPGRVQTKRQPTTQTFGGGSTAPRCSCLSARMASRTFTGQSPGAAPHSTTVLGPVKFSYARSVSRLVPAGVKPSLRHHGGQQAVPEASNAAQALRYLTAIHKNELRYLHGSYCYNGMRHMIISQQPTACTKHRQS